MHAIDYAILLLLIMLIDTYFINTFIGGTDLLLMLRLLLQHLFCWT